MKKEIQKKKRKADLSVTGYTHANTGNTLIMDTRSSCMNFQMHNGSIRLHRYGIGEEKAKQHSSVV